VWEFKLRRGVKFHNGDPVTAEDVKYSFDRVLDQTKKSPQYGNIRAIKEVKIVAPDTINIVTDKPFPLLLERLVFFPVVPKKHIEKVGDQVFGTTAPVGTGPWKFVEWKRDQYIKLEAFDGHWRGKPPFKTLVFRAIPEVSTEVAELKTGGVDIIRNVRPRTPSENQPRPVSSTPILRTMSCSQSPSTSGGARPPIAVNRGRPSRSSWGFGTQVARGAAGCFHTCRGSRLPAEAKGCWPRPISEGVTSPHSRPWPPAVQAVGPDADAGSIRAT
jgi:hypothetical protein